MKIDPNKVEFSIKVLPEEQSPDGFFASGDDEQDRKDVAWINDQLDRGNQWAWCIVTVTGKYGPLTARDSLFGCSYRDEADFISGGYYDDMKQQVAGKLESQLDTLANM